MPKLKPPFKLNVPMLLTWMRIAMIPLVIGIFYLPETWMTMGTKNATAMLMFVIAAITDALDGFLARRYQGWATPMGAFLDPVADKLLVSACILVAPSMKAASPNSCGMEARYVRHRMIFQML